MVFRRIARRGLQKICRERLSIAGKNIDLPLIFSARMGVSEPWMVDLVGCFTAFRSGALLDIGVNLGQTMAIFKSLCPERPYVGLEPNPDCISYAAELARLNGFRHVDLVPAALSDTSGLLQLEFYQDQATDSSASIIPGFRSDREVTSSKLVASITGDNLQQAISHLDIAILKIDVEGAEAVVLEELQGIIGQYKPLISLEILPIYSVENTERLSMQKRVESLLNQEGYRLFRLRTGPEGRLSGFEQIADVGIHGDMSKTEYAAVPSEALESFKKTVADRTFAVT